MKQVQAETPLSIFYSNPKVAALKGFGGILPQDPTGIMHFPAGPFTPIHNLSDAVASQGKKLDRVF